MLQTRRADRLRLLDTLDIKDARASFDATSAAGASSTHEAPTPLPLHSVLIARLACGSHEKEKPTPRATCCHFSRSVVLKADAPSRTGTRKSRTSAAGPSLPPSDALLLRIKNAAERLLRTALDATLQAASVIDGAAAAAWSGSDSPRIGTIAIDDGLRSPGRLGAGDRNARMRSSARTEADDYVRVIAIARFPRTALATGRVRDEVLLRSGALRPDERYGELCEVGGVRSRGCRGLT